MIDSGKTELVGALEDPKNVFGTVGFRQAVDYTMVNGSFTVRNGHLTGVDENKLAEEANSVCRQYLSRG